jgi:pyruvate formate lyase activating enzyme
MSRIENRFEWAPFSLTDLPGSCAIVYTRGCNYSCKYCFNIDMLDTNKGLYFDEIIEKIKSIREKNSLGKEYNKVDWLMLSGGEPFMASYQEIRKILQTAKDIGLKTGIFTNGSCPKNLLELINLGLIDFVNLDFKHYDRNQINIGAVNDSIWLLIELIDKLYTAYENLELEYLFINTVVCKTIHSKEVLDLMRKVLEVIIHDIPILFKRDYSEHKLGWIITPFYNDNNKIETLGKLDYNKERYTEQELKNLLI